MTESIANTTPINDIHAIQAERFEKEAQELDAKEAVARPRITLEEMRNMALFLRNRGVKYSGREAD
jgi:hypothetical protein